MKRIYLLRHAKAQEHSQKGDFYRKINKKGKQDIKLMLERIKTKELKLDIIFSSPALRTGQTAEEFALNLSCSRLEFKDFLYEAKAEQIFDFIKNLDDKYENIMLVGHNPALKECSQLMSKLIFHSFSTCSLLCLKFDCLSFKELEEHKGKLEFFESLKKYKIY